MVFAKYIQIENVYAVLIYWKTLATWLVCVYEFTSPAWIQTPHMER